MAEMEMKGTLNPQRFFDALALILSQREGVVITAKVTQKPKEEDKNE